MYKITQKITKEIVKKLGHKSVFALPAEELCVYAAYRLISIINEYEVIHVNEVKYRLCEIGPGRRRFDPLMLDIALCSKFFRDNIYNKYLLRAEEWFLREGSASEINIKKIKAGIIEHIYEATSSEKLFNAIEKKACSISQNCGYSVSGRVIQKEQRCLQLKLDHEEKQKMLLRIYNSVEWIHPNSWQIWEFAHIAAKENRIPILIAPKVHGSCFQLFKALGMLARASYYLYTERDIDEIKDSVIKNKIIDINLSLGKITSPMETAFRDSFLALEHLLSNIVPKYYEASYGRFIKNSGKIESVLNNNVVSLFGSKTADLNVIERTKKIRIMLSMKLGHLNAIKDMVKRNEELIKDLHCR